MESLSAHFTPYSGEPPNSNYLTPHFGDLTPSSSVGNSLTLATATKTLEVRPKLEHYKY